MAIIWHKDPPDLPGYYWANESRSHYPDEIVELCLDYDTGGWYVCRIGFEARYNVADFEWLWGKLVTPSLAEYFASHKDESDD